MKALGIKYKSKEERMTTEVRGEPITTITTTKKLCTLRSPRNDEEGAVRKAREGAGEHSVVTKDCKAGASVRENRSAFYFLCARAWVMWG